MTIDFKDFVDWALIKESSLIVVDEVDGLETKTISDYSKQQLEEGFNDASSRCKSLKSYMSNFNYRTLLYNYALHIAIVNSVFIQDVDADGFIEEPKEALQKLYIKYSVASNTAGIVTSSSSGGSSASSQLPTAITQGDLETAYLLGTQYGKTAEMFLEQLQGVLL